MFVFEMSSIFCVSALIQCSRCERGHTAFVEAMRTLARCHCQIDSEQKFGSCRVQVDRQG